MDSTQVRSHTINPRLTLSARQEELLFAALNSNSKTSDIDPSRSKDSSMPPGPFTESLQDTGSATMNGFEESLIVDYDYEFEGDGTFDYGDFNNDSQGQMTGNLLGISSEGGDNDSHDKRSHPDEGDEEEGGGKRRGGDEKTSKKPGRKPLTSEPTSMSIELREYRRRLSINGVSGRAPSVINGLPPYPAKGLENGGLNNPNDINFQFEFPRFGRLPGPSANPLDGTRNSSSLPAANKQISSPVVDKGQISPRNQSLQYTTNNGPSAGLPQKPAQLDVGDMSSLSGLFSPSLLESVGKTSPLYFSDNNNNNGSNGSRSSTDSANGNMSTGHNTTYSSPSASSNSNHGPSSSCGTSPEPTTLQFPVNNKPVDSSLTTIGEERSAVNGEGELTFCNKLNMVCGNSNNPVPSTVPDPGANSGAFAISAIEMNGIDWFAQQNNNQFDPQLFGDYREPQENILSNEAFGDSFFTDAFALGGDFTSPFNMALSPAPKKDLVAQIDEKQDTDYEDIIPANTDHKLNSTTIWDRLQACPKVKDGEFDLDLLCKDLQKKAKCSETGALVNESDFNQIVKSYVDQQKITKA
ncbi:transcription factor PAP1 [Diplocarpon rosae]|nr:transcription factor PAP1 [Diplocarpon rosae]